MTGTFPKPAFAGPPGACSLAGSRPAAAVGRRVFGCLPGQYEENLTWSAHAEFRTLSHASGVRARLFVCAQCGVAKPRRNSPARSKSEHSPVHNRSECMRWEGQGPAPPQGSRCGENLAPPRPRLELVSVAARALPRPVRSTPPAEPNTEMRRWFALAGTGVGDRAKAA